MTLRVQDLIDNPALRTRILAGSGSVDREIDWAHCCDEPNPWEWLGQRELVMTSGRHIPTDLEGQIAFLKNLDAAGVAGIAIAEDMGAPALAPEAKAFADDVGFPVLETAYEVPWVVMARAITDATTRAGHLTKIMRVYECYRQASLQNVDDTELLRRMSKEIGATLLVVDLPTRTSVLPSEAAVPHNVAERLVELAENPHLPGIVRVAGIETTHLILPTDGRHEVLVATMDSSSFDLVVLQHVTAIVSVLAERARATLTTRVNAGMSILAMVLEGRVDGELAKERLSELGMLPGPWQVISMRCTRALDPVTAVRALGNTVPTLVVPSDRGFTVLVTAADSKSVVESAVAMVNGAVGVSDVVRSINQLGDAVRESRWALEAAQGNEAAHYGVERPLFLPRTLTEARDVVARVLGGLIRYDEQHGTDLVHSLRVYFGSKRSWQIASRELMVHKQTLVYRMRRVEELTGRHLDDLDDVTELHLALRSLALLERT